MTLCDYHKEAVLYVTTTNNLNKRHLWRHKINYLKLPSDYHGIECNYSHKREDLQSMLFYSPKHD